MANGIIEPALHRVHDVGFGWNQFQSKFSAYVAPLKNYDAIIGRDTLRKWKAILNLDETTIETSIEETTPNEGVEVLDKMQNKRILLKYGKQKDLESDTDRVWSGKKLEEELVKTPELMVYEIYITNIQPQTTHVENPINKDHDQQNNSHPPNTSTESDQINTKNKKPSRTRKFYTTQTPRHKH